MNGIQILGYAASLIVFVSLMMKSLAKLRVLNAAGSLLFVVFALKTASLPTAFLNMGIVVIDLYYFIRMTRVKDNFEIMTVQKDNEIVRRFCRVNQKELDALFGRAAFENSEKIALFFRNDDIAGLLAYSSVVLPPQADSSMPENAAEILIDFVVPKYRDFAVGRHFFVKDVSFWKEQGYTCLLSSVPDKRHIPYLERLGFERQNDFTVWKKSL